MAYGSIVNFEWVEINVGNKCEPNTGEFKAPNPGLYHLTAVVMSDNRHSLILCLCHNGLLLTRRYLTGDGYKTGTFDVIFNLQKWDTVFIDSHTRQTIYSDVNK